MMTNGECSNTAHDWEKEKRRTRDKEKSFFDDGTMTFFWWALLIFIFMTYHSIGRVFYKVNLLKESYGSTRKSWVKEYRKDSTLYLTFELAVPSVGAQSAVMHC